MRAGNLIAGKAVKLAGAAIEARDRGDMEQALFLARKASEALTLAKALGYEPAFRTRAVGAEVSADTETDLMRSEIQTVIRP